MRSRAVRPGQRNFASLNGLKSRVPKTSTHRGGPRVASAGAIRPTNDVTKTAEYVTLLSMRIALYARVSTKDKGQDHENQLRELRALVTRKASDGWAVAGEFVDRVSGKTADRPAFRRMFDAASRKEFDLVLFWSLDRFSREGVLETL